MNAGDQKSNYIYESNSDFLLLVLEACTAVYAFMWMYREVKEHARDPDLSTKENQFDDFVTETNKLIKCFCCISDRTMFTRPFSVMVAMSVLLALLLRLICAVSYDTTLVVAHRHVSALSLFMAITLLYRNLSVLDYTGALVVVVADVIVKHILRFLIVFGVALLGFASVLHLLLHDSEEFALIDMQNGFTTWPRSVSTTFNALIEGADWTPIYNSSVVALFAIVFYSVLGTVLMLNLLVAMMNTTYKRIAKRADLLVRVNQITYLFQAIPTPGIDTLVDWKQYEMQHMSRDEMAPPTDESEKTPMLQMMLQKMDSLTMKIDCLQTQINTAGLGEHSDSRRSSFRESDQQACSCVDIKGPREQPISDSALMEQGESSVHATTPSSLVSNSSRANGTGSCILSSGPAPMEAQIDKDVMLVGQEVGPDKAECDTLADKDSTSVHAHMPQQIQFIDLEKEPNIVYNSTMAN